MLAVIRSAPAVLAAVVLTIIPASAAAQGDFRAAAEAAREASEGHPRWVRVLAAAGAALGAAYIAHRARPAERWCGGSPTVFATVDHCRGLAPGRGRVDDDAHRFLPQGSPVLIGGREWFVLRCGPGHVLNCVDGSEHAEVRRGRWPGGWAGSAALAAGVGAAAWAASGVRPSSGDSPFWRRVAVAGVVAVAAGTALHQSRARQRDGRWPAAQGAAAGGLSALAVWGVVHRLEW